MKIVVVSCAVIVKRCVDGVGEGGGGGFVAMLGCGVDAGDGEGVRGICVVAGVGNGVGNGVGKRLGNGVGNGVGAGVGHGKAH